MESNNQQKVLDWLLQQYNHPLSLILLVLGSGLLWLGLSGSVPFQAECDSVLDEHRWFCLLTGLAAIVTAVVLFYIPPPAVTADVDETAYSSNQTIPNVLNKPFLVRLGVLSGTQRNILKLVEDEKKITLDKIQSLNSQLAAAELYYRLEQLQLLGFIKKQKPESTSLPVIYSLAAGYIDAISDPDVTSVKTVFVEPKSL